jgi:hypothetical protein
MRNKSFVSLSGGPLMLMEYWDRERIGICCLARIACLMKCNRRARSINRHSVMLDHEAEEPLSLQMVYWFGRRGRDVGSGCDRLDWLRTQAKASVSQRMKPESSSHSDEFLGISGQS